MKSTFAIFPSPDASGIGYDRAASPDYDAPDRPATVPYDGITIVSHDYDGLDQHPTVTACRNIPTYFYLAAGDQSSGESTCEGTVRFGGNPINRVDPTGLKQEFWQGWGDVFLAAFGGGETKGQAGAVWKGLGQGAWEGFSTTQNTVSFGLRDAVMTRVGFQSTADYTTPGTAGSRFAAKVFREAVITIGTAGTLNALRGAKNTMSITASVGKNWHMGTEVGGRVIQGIGGLSNTGGRLGIGKIIIHGTFDRVAGDYTFKFTLSEIPTLGNAAAAGLRGVRVLNCVDAAARVVIVTGVPVTVGAPLGSWFVPSPYYEDWLYQDWPFAAPTGPMPGAKSKPLF